MGIITALALLLVFQSPPVESDTMHYTVRHSTRYLIRKKVVHTNCRTPNDTIFISTINADTLVGSYIFIDDSLKITERIPRCNASKPSNSCLFFYLDSFETEKEIRFTYGCVGNANGYIYYHEEGWVRDGSWAISTNCNFPSSPSK